MPSIRRGSAASSSPLVWVLGSRHPCADKSIGWDDSLPNLSDPDVVIVDLTTLTEEVVERMDKTTMKAVQRDIRDKYCSNGTIVVMAQRPLCIRQGRHTYSNYDVLPIGIEVRDVPRGSRIAWGSHKIFRAYKGNVDGFSFCIEGFELKSTCPRLGALPNIGMCTPPGQEITDHSQRLLGCVLALCSRDETGGYTPIAETGHMIFLPPPTKPAMEAIGSILSAYGKALPRGRPVPEWAAKLPLAAAERLDAEIEGLEKKVGSLRGEISARVEERDAILAHRRLLFAKGPGLEDAVGEAFKTLGFVEIERRGGPDAEDWTFGASTNGCQHAVVEVKGADKRTKHRHIVQCNKWADDLEGRSGESIKGILVANQYCSSEYPKSIDDRAFFEPNELSYADRKDVCIIPSFVLYEAVKKVLDGEAAPDRSATERRITGARGVLRDVL